MNEGPLCSPAANCFGRDVLDRCPGGHRERELRPHWADDEGVESPTTHQEVSDGSVYHTPAPLPIPSPRSPARSPTRAGPRGHLACGHLQAGPQQRGRPLEGGPLYALGDLLDLLLADAQPRSLLPVCPQAAGRLDGAARSEAPRRGHRSVLQGPCALARIGPASSDAPAGLPSAPPGARAVAVVWPQGQGRRWQHGAHARHPDQPEGVSPEPVSEVRLGLPDRPDRGALQPGHRLGVGTGPRQIPRETDRRECLVSQPV